MPLLQFFLHHTFESDGGLACTRRSHQQKEVFFGWLALTKQEVSATLVAGQQREQPAIEASEIGIHMVMLDGIKIKLAEDVLVALGELQLQPNAVGVIRLDVASEHLLSGGRIRVDITLIQNDCIANTEVG